MNNFFLTTITRARVDTSKPKITFFAPWMRPMGFVPGALVQFLPEQYGGTFTLCENIPKYSELARITKEKGGTFIHANFYRHRIHPSLSLAGKVLEQTGLAFGDALLLRYEPGFIRARRLPWDVRVVTSAIFGNWLTTIGFIPDSALTVESAPGLITCTLQENGRGRTAELVKYARQNRVSLVQVIAQRDNNHYPRFQIPPGCMEKAGFTQDSAMLATYEHGLIQLHKLDLVALGFETIPETR